MIAVVSPEIDRGAVKVKSAYNAATARITGIEPQYQDIRTIELEYGRNFTWTDEDQVARVAIVGFDMAEQLFGKRNILNEQLTLNGMPYTVVGKIRKKAQDSNYSGPDNNKIFVPFAAMAQDLPRRDAAGTLLDHRRATRVDRCRAPTIHAHRMAALARTSGDSGAPAWFDPSGKQAMSSVEGRSDADVAARSVTAFFIIKNVGGYAGSA